MKRSDIHVGHVYEGSGKPGNTDPHRRVVGSIRGTAFGAFPDVHFTVPDGEPDPGYRSMYLDKFCLWADRDVTDEGTP